MDYLAPLFNEAALLPGGREAARHRGSRSGRRPIRVLMMELNRISSHLVGLATDGMELGALTDDDRTASASARTSSTSSR